MRANREDETGRGRFQRTGERKYADKTVKG